MRRIIVLVILLCGTLSLFSQNSVTVSGFVYDNATGEVLIGATIFDKKSSKGAVSNEFGFYSLTTTSLDSLDIYVSFIGYKQLNIKCAKSNNDQLDFFLKAGINLKEVTILEIKKETIVTRNETSVVRIPMKDIKALPNLCGEVDIIRAFQMTPGVQSGGEAKSSMYIRGGSPDQNLFLLDDVPLYYVAHFGGFLSVFNADAINDVKLIKGGFPARYGSRLSSVLDIRLKEGNMKKLAVQGSVGLLSAKVTVEAPIIVDKMSFIVSIRKNTLPIFKLFGTGISYNFYDLNAKLNYKYSKKDKFLFSIYMGDDNISLKNNNDISSSKNAVKWGNSLFSLGWIHIYNKKLFSKLTLSNTYYRYKTDFEYETEVNNSSKSIENSLLTGINDLSLKMDYSYIMNTNASFKFGFNSIYHTFIPNDESFTQSVSGEVNISEDYSSKTIALENAIYLENEIKYKKINSNIGGRFSSYNTGNSNYISFEPRILINFIIRDDLSLKYSFSKMNQYIHLLSYSGSGIPSDYWMPTNDKVKPENSTQNALGLAKTFKKGMFELSLETYHKTLTNLITFIPGESFMGNLDSWDKLVEIDGEGMNYGLELFLQKLKGKTTGWVGVTIAKAERKFDNINDGKSYAFKYDRLLDLSIVANHELNSKIILSATWTYGTGYPITLATEYYNYEGKDILVYKDKNSYKMRDYHRLDIAINFPKKTKWGERTWTISIFNLYNRQNPYYYYYERSHTSSTSTTTSGGYVMTDVAGGLKLYQKSLFSIFPSFSYSFKF